MWLLLQHCRQATQTKPLLNLTSSEDPCTSCPVSCSHYWGGCNCSYKWRTIACTISWCDCLNHWCTITDPIAWCNCLNHWPQGQPSLVQLSRPLVHHRPM